MTFQTLHEDRRGYSLPEVLIASALLGLLLVAAISWLGTLVEVTVTHADLARPRITARFVSSQFTDDVYAATACDPAGVGGVLHAVGDNEVGFYINPDGAGAADVVWWTFDDTAGTLLREVETSVDCDASGLPTAPGVTPDTLATNVGQLGTAPAFAGLGGYSPGYVGSCTTSAEPRDCLFDAVRLRLRPTSPATGAPAVIDRTVDLDLTSSLL